MEPGTRTPVRTASLLVLFISLFAWAESYRAMHGVSATTGATTWNLWSTTGRIAWEGMTPPFRLVVSYPFPFFYGHGDPLPACGGRRAGFGWHTQRSWGHTQRVVVMSWWHISACAGLVSAASIARLARKRRALRRRGHCPHCGYDLRATPGRCPECGRGAAVQPK